MKIPQVIRTSDLQRNIGLLGTLPDDEMYIITKTGRMIGIFVPMELFKKLGIEFEIVKQNDVRPGSANDVTGRLRRMNLLK